MNIFNTVLVYPMINFITFFYDKIPDLGVAIIALTVLIKLILWPVNQKSIKAQKDMKKVQSKINEIKEKYKDDPQKQSAEMMGVYKKENVNPFSSCLTLLIQLPILIALFQTLRIILGINEGFDINTILYSFVNSVEFNPIAFGFLNLIEKSIWLAILAGAFQFLQSKMLVTGNLPKANEKNEGKDEKMASVMNKQMLYFMPALTVFIGLSFPAGLTLYWCVNSIITALQSFIAFLPLKKEKPVAIANNKNNKELESEIIDADIIEDDTDKDKK
ncbi:YidC/Oxa1 family membrane protein insertase [Patescibacteria group bacterium]|nr:YidC/Oxa1 family membrane protein insertase [Patescibacteria group bacterium]